MSKKNIEVIFSKNLSQNYDNRYIVIDKDTGEVLDDANGYGFKTKKKAYVSWYYKQKPKKVIKNEKKILRWMEKHPKFEDQLNDDLFHATKSGIKSKITVEYIEDLLEYLGLEEILNEFSAEEFIEVLK